jgi:hypothetical protein
MSEHLSYDEARHNADKAIRKLWLALNTLSEFGVRGLVKEDLDLMRRVTKHPAVQTVLTQSIQEQQDERTGKTN